MRTPCQRDNNFKFTHGRMIPRPYIIHSELVLFRQENPLASPPLHTSHIAALTPPLAMTLAARMPLYSTPSPAAKPAPSKTLPSSYRNGILEVREDAKAAIPTLDQQYLVRPRFPFALQ